MSKNESDRSVTEFYEHDHEEIDEQFDRYRKLKGSDFAEAQGCFVSFYEGLNRHIEWEEDVLFPELEEAIGPGLTGTMRVEHDQIQEILESLHETIVEEGEPTDDYEEERLLKYLQPHNDSEETVVYPAVDKHLDAETIEIIFERMDQTGEP